MVLQDNLLLLISLSKLFFFRLRAKIETPQNVRFKWTTEWTTDPSQASYKLTKCRNTLRAAATAAASNKGLFT